MKKLLFMAFVAAIAFASCNDNDDMNTANEKSSLLSIVTEINAQQKSLRSSGPLSSFPYGSTLSLFVCSGSLDTSYPGGPYDNIKATFDATDTWSMERPVRLTSENATIYALYPYMLSLGIGTVEIDHTTQMDYMFGMNAEGQQAINHNNPSVRLRMNHAQALLQFRINRLNYEDEGRVTRLEIANNTGIQDLCSKGSLNIATGEIVPIGGQEAAAVVEDAGGLVTIPDVALGNDSYIDVMILPVSNTTANGSVRFLFTIDGEVYTYNVPANTIWKQGTRYLYEVTLNGTELQVGDVIITDWIEGPQHPIELF